MKFVEVEVKTEVKQIAPLIADRYYLTQLYTLYIYSCKALCYTHYILPSPFHLSHFTIPLVGSGPEGSDELWYHKGGI